MKPDLHDSLLNEVLDDGAAFRDATLRQTLALARARRRRRVVRRVAAASAVLAGVVWCLLPHSTAPELKPAPPVAASLRIVHTVSLASGEIVRPAGAGVETVHTESAGVAVITSRADAVTHIASRDNAPMIRYLDDQQLLAIFSDEHPALIDPGTPNARLVVQ